MGERARVSCTVICFNEEDNIRAALDRAVAEEDAATAIRIGFGMWRYWQKRGHLIEAKRRLDGTTARTMAATSMATVTPSTIVAGSAPS